MNTRLKATILMLTVVVLTAGLSGYIAFSDDQAALESSMHRELLLVEKLAEKAIGDQLTKASGRAAIISNLPSVQRAFRAGDRGKLLDELQATLIIQREQFGVREADFHLPPATSFLRVFDPDEPAGEDLSGFRHMVVATNQQQSPHEGISIGRRGMSLRGVYPVADSQGHIGSFELGIDFGTVVRIVKDTTGFDAAVLVERQLMRDIATQIPSPEDYKIVGDYQLVVATNWAFIKPLLSPQALRGVRKPSQDTHIMDGETYGGVIVPLRDAAGRVIGSLIAYRSFDHYVKHRNWALVRSVAASVLQVLLLTGVVLVILNGMLLRPLAALTRMIDGAPEDIPGERNNLLQRRDEIGTLARHLKLDPPQKDDTPPRPGSTDSGEAQFSD
jgi:methyl-accepting chemotaxis protein